MNQKSDLLNGSISAGILKFTWPLFLANLFQQLYNVVDSLIVGNFLGSTELAAVTSTGSLIFLFVGFFNGTATGAGVVISKYYGMGDHDKLRRAIHTDVAFGLACGALMTLLGVIFAPQILILMGTPAEVLPLSTTYLRIYFAGSMTIIMYANLTGALQAVGDSTHPLIYLLISAVINVVLDYVFIAILGFSVGSAAVATVISQGLAAALCFAQLLGTKEIYRVHLSEIRFHKEMITQMLRLGLPSGVQNSVISIANVVVQSHINSFGEFAMAGNGIYAKLNGFAFLPVTCFSMSMTTFIGQNLGAKQYDRAKKGAKFGLCACLITAECIGLLVRFSIGGFAKFFTDVPAVIEYSVTEAHIESFFFFLLAFDHCVSGIMRGAGKAIVGMIGMLTFWCVIRVAYITIVTSFIPDIRVVFWAYPLTWFLCAVFLLIYFIKADWIHGLDRSEVL